MGGRSTGTKRGPERPMRCLWGDTGVGDRPLCAFGGEPGIGGTGGILCRFLFSTGMQFSFKTARLAGVFVAEAGETGAVAEASLRSRRFGTAVGGSCGLVSPPAFASAAASALPDGGNDSERVTGAPWRPGVRAGGTGCEVPRVEFRAGEGGGESRPSSLARSLAISLWSWLASDRGTIGAPSTFLGVGGCESARGEGWPRCCTQAARAAKSRVQRLSPASHSRGVTCAISSVFACPPMESESNRVRVLSR